VHGRHVNQEASGKRDVTRDARALFAEWLFGDLDNDILTGFEHLGNELRSARRAGASALVSAVTALMASATGAATLEASAGTSATATAAMIATSAITTAIAAATVTTTVAAAIVAATIATSVTPATAKRTLEARAWIAAADARGITWREFFTRSASGTR
jgi:hypothetical protein